MTSAFPQDSRSPYRQQRWVEIRNDDVAEAPAFAACQVIDYAIEDGRTILQVEQPTVDSQSNVVINGLQPVSPGAQVSVDEGKACTNDYPAWVLFDSSDGAASIGLMVGTKRSSWKMHAGRQGFVVVGISDAGDMVRVLRNERLIRSTIEDGSPPLLPGDETNDAQFQAWGSAAALWSDTNSIGKQVYDKQYRACAFPGESFWVEQYGDSYHAVGETGLRRVGVADETIQPGGSGSVTIYGGDGCVKQATSTSVNACLLDSANTVSLGDYVFLHYHPEFQKWYIIPVATPSSLMRFEMLTSLPFGGRGTAIEVGSGGNYTRIGTPFPIKDPWGQLEIQTPETALRGMWRYDPADGKPSPYNSDPQSVPRYRGYMGFCFIPANPEIDEQGEPYREIVWMEQIARSINFIVVEDPPTMLGQASASPGESQWVKVSLTSYYMQGKNPEDTNLVETNQDGSITLDIYDPKMNFPRVIEGCFGMARYSDRFHRYEIIQCNQMAWMLDASLGQDLCPGQDESIIASYSNITFSNYGVPPETNKIYGPITTHPLNIYGCAGESGDLCVLVWDEYRLKWVVLTVKHKEVYLMSNIGYEQCGIKRYRRRISTMYCDPLEYVDQAIGLQQVDLVNGFGTTSPSGQDENCRIDATTKRICTFESAAGPAVNVAIFSPITVLQDVDYALNGSNCLDGWFTRVYVPCSEATENIVILCGTDCNSSGGQ